MMSRYKKMCKLTLIESKEIGNEESYSHPNKKNLNILNIGISINLNVNKLEIYKFKL